MNSILQYNYFKAFFNQVYNKKNHFALLYRLIRKIIKSKRAFSSEQALMKLMYLIIKDIAKKWGTYKCITGA